PLDQYWPARKDPIEKPTYEGRTERRPNDDRTSPRARAPLRRSNGRRRRRRGSSRFRVHSVRRLCRPGRSRRRRRAVGAPRLRPPRRSPARRRLAPASLFRGMPRRAGPRSRRSRISRIASYRRAARARHSAPVQARRAPVRILLADPDEVSSRKLELALVAEPSVEVIGWAGDSDDALELAARWSADVVLLAVDFPGARETVERLVRQLPIAPKVLLIAGDGTRDGVNGLTALRGISGFVRRTDELSHMVTLVIALVALAGVPDGERNGTRSYSASDPSR